MPNRRIHEDSPSLQHHKNSPVDWFSWYDEASIKADKRTFKKISKEHFQIGHLSILASIYDEKGVVLCGIQSCYTNLTKIQT